MNATPESKQSRFYSVRDLMELSGYTEQHIRRLEREGAIPRFFRRAAGCRVFGDDTHAAALTGRNAA